MNRAALLAMGPHHEEFLRARTESIRSRLRLFCALAVTVYLATGILGWVTLPDEFKSIELVTWAFLTLAAAVALLLNHRAGTLAQAKTVSILFALSVTATLTAAFLIYPRYAIAGPGIFAVNLFFVCFVIPWDLSETALMAVLSVLGYGFVYGWIQALGPDEARARFTPREFADGFIFLGIAIVLCFVIRKRDNAQERTHFVLMKELEDKCDQIERELVLAQDIHKTLIPKSMSTENADVAVSYVPVRTVGGDYATFHVARDGRLLFLISDVTGHGVPAALLVNRLYGETQSLIERDLAPGALLKELDRFVQTHFRHTRMYLSACCGVLDFKAGALAYSNYGHPPQILHQRSGDKIMLLESQTYLLGIGQAPGAGAFEGQVRFGRGDRIILFTDGLIETRGKDGDLFGMDRLERFARENAKQPPSPFNTNLLEEVRAFREGPVADDIFLVSVDIR